MQHNIASVITRLNRYHTPIATLTVALIVTSGLLIGSVGPTNSPMARKSRSGRWTQITSPSMPLLGEAILLTVEI